MSGIDAALLEEMLSSIRIIRDEIRDVKTDLSGKGAVDSAHAERIKQCEQRLDRIETKINNYIDSHAEKDIEDALQQGKKEGRQEGRNGAIKYTVYIALSLAALGASYLGVWPLISN